ncbi:MULTISPECIES: TAXI family TRAP transporter solute-binding subunit [Rhodomicrobium]|uniref:TAXI family TRAP transporter solute-binding subunit n=1 Tax=Rhodomicrobium TaxID=1068 RepID=UPI000B4ACC42|nr:MULTISPECIES: TAXI family TRAP transporter solute-binding subunit [Rhodomicrobium]
MFVVVFLALLLIPTISRSQTPEMRNLAILTGKKELTYYKIGSDIARIVEKECGANLEVKESRGSLDSFQRLRDEAYVQMAIVQQDVINYLTRFASEDKQIKRLVASTRYVFPLYSEEIHIVTTADSGIKAFGDLQGKRVALGSPESGTYMTSTFLLLTAGVSVRPAEVDGKEAFQRLLLPNEDAQKLDAIFLVAGAPIPLLTEEEKNRSNLALVPIEDSRLTNLKPYFVAKITKDDYRWLSEPVPTLAVMSVLVAFNFQEEHCLNIGMVANRVKANIEELKRTAGTSSHAKWAEVNLSMKLSGLETYECVSKYIDRKVVKSSNRQCSFAGGGGAPDRLDCAAKSPNKIFQHLCDNLPR